MSYYILPKKNINFNINPIFTEKPLDTYVSHSLIYYLNDMNKQIEDINSELLIECNVDFLNSIVNQYEFIYSKVPNTKLSVSKLKPFSNTFYIFMELNNLFNILDYFENINILIMCHGINSMSIVEYINLFRENNNDIFLHNTINFNNNLINKRTKKDNAIYASSVDFLFYELDDDIYMNNNNYINGLMYIISNLLYYQSANGISIIKISNIFYKPVIDILYLLSSLYEKVYIIKPNVTNIINNDRYVVCKNFIFNFHKVSVYNGYISRLDYILMRENMYISSLLQESASSLLLNKIEESNLIIGHQQLEYMDQIISLYKNKNKEDKIEVLKKINIQKCISWCEKFKIPYNKFTDKVNIFYNV